MLADLGRRTLSSVRPPGPQAVRHTVLRRQRNRVTATALAAVIAIGGALGAYLSTGPRRGIAPAGPTVSATSPSQPAPSSQQATSSSAPNSSTPSSSPASATPGPMPADLHLSGPTELTLTPSNGKYHGTLTMTLHNTGPTPYGRTLIFTSSPDGLSFDFPNQPLWGPCFLIQGDEPMECNGPAISARGGTMTITWAITLDYAPGSAMTLPQPFTFRAAAVSNDAQVYDDPTPDDNKISVTLKLAAA